MEKKLNREMLEALVKIQTQLNKLEFEEMLNFLVDQVVEVIKIERCSIFRIFSDIETACLIAGEPKKEGEHGIGMKFSFSELEQLKEVVETKSYLLIEEPWQDSRTRNTRDLIYFKDIKAMLLIPLLARAEVVAILVADATREKRTFTEEEVYFCLIMSNLAGFLLERDLLHKEQEEKDAFVRLGRVADEAAHKLRNPLTEIGGWARRLARKLKDSEYESDANRIASGVSKTEELLNGLLCYTAPKKVNVQKTDIEDLIEKAVQETNALIGGREIKVDYINGGLPRLMIDAEEIKRALSDILTNAVEAIGDKKGKVLIKSKTDGSCVRISITNSGGCIDKEITDEIFNPFFTTKEGAAGLGLAVAGSIIRAYNGEIRVGSNRDLDTTTFIIRLPIQN